jgi:hypothetical protein
MEVCGQLASSPGRLNAAERISSNHWTEGRVVPIAGLDVLETRISYPCMEPNLQ